MTKRANRFCARRRFLLTGAPLLAICLAIGAPLLTILHPSGLGLSI
jgi:hypothetical protein